MKIRNLRYWILTADLLWVLGALGLAMALRYTGTRDAIDVTTRFQAYLFMIIAAVVAWTLLYFEMSLDGFKGGWHFPTILSKLMVAVLLLMVVVLTSAYLTKHYYSRLVLFYFAFFFCFGLIALRCLVRFLVIPQLRSMAEHRCIILGQGPIARELASKIGSHPEIPFQVVGYLFPGESESFNGFAGSLEE